MAEEKLKDKHGEYKVTRWINMEAYTGKDFIDTHFSFINRRLEAYVLAGNNVTTQQEIYQALSWKNGLAGTSVFVLDFSGLSSLPSTKTATTQLDSNQFKCKKTGVKSTHDILFYDDEVLVYRYTGVTVAETIKGADLEMKKIAELDVKVKKHPVTQELYKYESSIPALFVKKKGQEAMDEPPDAATATADAPVAAATDNVEDAVIAPRAAKRTKYDAVTSALKTNNVVFGDDADHSNSQGLTIVPNTGNNTVSAEQVAAALSSLDHGWANKDFSHDEKCLSVATLKRLHYLEERGRRNKNLRTTQDGAFEDVRRLDRMPDFCERLQSTLARIKAIIDMDTAKREALIKEAEAREGTSNGLTVVVPEAAVEEAEEALEGAEAEEEALVDEDDNTGTAAPQPNAVAIDLDATDVDGDVRSLPASRSGRRRQLPGRLL